MNILCRDNFKKILWDNSRTHPDAWKAKKESPDLEMEPLWAECKTKTKLKPVLVMGELQEHRWVTLLPVCQTFSSEEELTQWCWERKCHSSFIQKNLWLEAISCLQINAYLILAENRFLAILEFELRASWVF
jgi:hypothetical protein